MSSLSALLFLLLLPFSLSQRPFLFPHGYFDSSKLKPFDAIYLNMMAQSNLEYGGVTLEELDALDGSRKVIERPPDIGRTREEDDKSLDREPSQGAPVEKGHLEDRETDEKRPRSPFSRVRLQTRRLRDDPVDKEEENPFEDIATRAPPRSRSQFRAARRHLRKGKKHHHHRHRTSHRSKNGRPHRSDDERDEEIFSLKKKRRHRSDESISIEMDDPPKKKKKSSTAQATPTLVPEPTSRPIPPPSPSPSPSSSPSQPIHRLPNNPFRELDLSRPTVIKLPVPPGADEEFQ